MGVLDFESADWGFENPDQGILGTRLFLSLGNVKSPFLRNGKILSTIPGIEIFFIYSEDWCFI